MGTTRIWKSLKKPVAVTAFNFGVYKLIQSAKSLDPSPIKDFLNQDVFAGSVSSLAMVVNGFSIIDSFTLLYKYGDKSKLGDFEKGFIIFSGLLSLATMIYTGFNFFDQRHTGVVGLASTISTLFSSLSLSNLKAEARFRENQEQEESKWGERRRSGLTSSGLTGERMTGPHQ